MKEQIIRKLTSRKLWIAIIGIVVGLATSFGIEGNEYAPIAGNICSIVSAITYIISEAKIDAANVGCAKTETDPIETTTNEEGVENE